MKTLREVVLFLVVLSLFVIFWMEVFTWLEN
jgi:uncharacterized membrane protein